MKKLALGLGILALSATSFAAIITKDTQVNVNATISGTGQEIFLYSMPGYAPITGDINLVHPGSHFGNLIPPVNKTIAAMLRPTGGGNAIVLTQGTDTVMANFKNTNLNLEHATLEETEFTSTLSVNNSGNISNNEKTFIIISTPQANSTTAPAGSYSGSETLTVTINKM